MWIEFLTAHGQHLKHLPPILSAQNNTVKNLVKLRTKRTRDTTQQYIIEGQREVSRAVATSVFPIGVYVCPECLELTSPSQQTELAILLANLPANTPLTTLSPAAFAKASQRQNPDGIIAIAKQKTITLDTLTTRKSTTAELTTKENGLYLVVDGLEKPGNLGALLRTADSVGVQAVFLTGGGTDIYNPNVIRASMGSFFNQTIITTETSTLQAWLAANSISIIATTPHTKTDYWQPSYQNATAIVLGAEHSGLSEDWLAAADVHVMIPMGGQADSLNVATSGALLLYEVLRQRQNN